MKLLYVGTSRAYMSMFVNPGTLFETKVALGTYDIVTATGDTWFGPEYRFGSSTKYYALQGTFEFRKSDRTYEGHRLELTLVSNGNLRQDGISSAQFGSD